MKPTQKLKPLAARIHVMYGGEEKFLWTTSLVPYHVQDDAVMAAGAVCGADGRAVGTLQVGGMPVSEWPQKPPPGRPRKDEEHLALLLAWYLLLHRNHGKRGNTDEQLAVQWGLSDGKKVARIRKEQAEKYGIDLSDENPRHLLVSDQTHKESVEAAVLIHTPTWYRQDRSIEVLGQGYAWLDGFEKRVAAGAMRVLVDEVHDDFKFDEISELEGPVIISVIRSPQ